MAVVDGVHGVAAPASKAVEEGRKPPAAVKFFYSLGQVVESSYLAANGFVFFYYTAVLGLSGSVVGAALAISLCLDAAADPLIGSWSDSVRSRFGRRLPVMLVGAPLTFLTMGLLFMPPAGLRSSATCGIATCQVTGWALVRKRVKPTTVHHVSRQSVSGTVSSSDRRALRRRLPANAAA